MGGLNGGSTPLIVRTGATLTIGVSMADTWLIFTSIETITGMHIKQQSSEFDDALLTPSV